MIKINRILKSLIAVPYVSYDLQLDTELSDAMDEPISNLIFYQIQSKILKINIPYDTTRKT